jgi:hypothetical protein
MPKLFKEFSSTLASLFSIVHNGKFYWPKINGKNKRNSSGTTAIAT